MPSVFLYFCVYSESLLSYICVETNYFRKVILTQVHFYYILDYMVHGITHCIKCNSFYPQIQFPILRFSFLSSDPVSCSQIQFPILRSSFLSSDPVSYSQIQFPILRSSFLFSDPVSYSQIQFLILRSNFLFSDPVSYSQIQFPILRSSFLNTLHFGIQNNG